MKQNLKQWSTVVFESLPGWRDIVLLSFTVLFASGCGEMFNKKPSEIESRAILNELGRIRENPNVKNPIPEVYRSPNHRMSVDDGVKVFYFARNTPADILGENVKNLGFKVSSNSSTNQLILHCPDDEQADRVLEYLDRVDVPPIQVNIDCLILERFGDVTKDWASTLLAENLFDSGITLGEGKYPNPAFPGASLREAKRSDFGLDFGYWVNKGEDGEQIRLLVDALVSRGYLKILMNPTLETINGKGAKVEIRDNAPITKTVTVKDEEPYDLIDYQWVTDSLQVTPSVYADGVIGLKTSIVIGSKSKPEGVVQNAIITERSIDVSENRIEPGKSLVIGGMRKSENRSVVRGVPFLKDIPLIGVLFSSKDFEENANEIIFILTPSISSGGTEYSQMAATLREKQRMIEPEDSLMNVLADPLGTDVYTKYVTEEAHKSEAEMIKAQRETLEAETQAQEQRQRAHKARREAQQLKDQAEQAQRNMDQARTRIEQSRVAAQEAQQQTEAQRQQAEKIQQAMEHLRLQAQKATEEAQNAALQAQQAEQKAAELEEKAKQARAEAEKARIQSEQADRQQTENSSAEQSLSESDKNSQQSQEKPR